MRPIAVIILIILSVNAFAQDTVYTRVNLNQCIAIALKNNVDVQRSSIRVENAKINWQQQRANLLPSINGGITHGLNRSRSIDPLTNTYVDREVSYASPYLNGSLLLFNGLALQNIIKQYSFIAQAAKQEEEQARNDLTLNVILAYLQALTNQDLLKQAKTRQETTVKQLERLETLNKNGAIAPAEYYNLKGEYAADQLTVVNTANALDNSKISLVRLLNIPYDQQLVVDELSAAEFLLVYEAGPDEIYQAALQNLASVKAAELRNKAADLQLRSNRGGYFPSVYFNAGLASSFSNAARDLQDRPIGYFNQFNNNQSKSFSIGIAVPVLNSFRTKNAIALARLNQRESDLLLQGTRTELQQLIQQAYFNMTASKDRYQSLKEQVEAYTEAFRTVEIRFNAGVINSVDYLIAKNNLDRVMAEMLANRYDYILRKKILDFYQGNPLSFN